MAEEKKPVFLRCSWCGETFESFTGEDMYCSDECDYDARSSGQNASGDFSSDEPEEFSSHRENQNAVDAAGVYPPGNHMPPVVREPFGIRFHQEILVLIAYVFGYLFAYVVLHCDHLWVLIILSVLTAVFLNILMASDVNDARAEWNLKRSRTTLRMISRPIYDTMPIEEKDENHDR